LLQHGPRARHCALRALNVGDVVQVQFKGEWVDATVDAEFQKGVKVQLSMEGRKYHLTVPLWRRLLHQQQPQKQFSDLIGKKFEGSLVNITDDVAVVDVNWEQLCTVPTYLMPPWSTALTPGAKVDVWAVAPRKRPVAPRKRPPLLSMLEVSVDWAAEVPTETWLEARITAVLSWGLFLIVYEPKSTNSTMAGRVCPGLVHKDNMNEDEVSKLKTTYAEGQTLQVRVYKVGPNQVSFTTLKEIPRHFKPSFTSSPKESVADEIEQKPIRIFVRLSTDPIARLLEFSAKPSTTELDAALARTFPQHSHWRRAVPHKDFADVLVDLECMDQLQDGAVVSLHAPIE